MSLGWGPLVILLAQVVGCSDEARRCSLDPTELDVSLALVGLDQRFGEIDDSSGFGMSAGGAICGTFWGAGQEGAFVCAGSSSTAPISEIIPSVGSRPNIVFTDKAIHVAFVRAFAEVLHATMTSDGVAIEPIPDCGTPTRVMLMVDEQPRVLCVSGDSSSLAIRGSAGKWTSEPVLQPDIASLSALAATAGDISYGVFAVAVPFAPGEVHWPGSSKVELRLDVLPSGDLGGTTIQVLATSSGFGLLDFILTPDGRFALLAIEGTVGLDGSSELQLLVFTGTPGEPDSVAQIPLVRGEGRRYRGRLAVDDKKRLHIAWFELKEDPGQAFVRRLGYGLVVDGDPEPEMVVYEDTDSAVGGFLAERGLVDLLRLDLDSKGRAVARALLTESGASTAPLATIKFPYCR